MDLSGRCDVPTVLCRSYHYHFTGPLGPFPKNPPVTGYPYTPGCFKVYWPAHGLKHVITSGPR
jgi:hypothetical protein